MKKLIFPVACLACLSFILWVLPLGYFIKPSQEKFACDGQRAMCMCHVMMGHRSADKAMESGIVLKAGAAANKENSSGSGNYFVSAKPIVALNLHSASIFEDRSLSYKNPFLESIEYVPKF